MNTIEGIINVYDLCYGNNSKIKIEQQIKNTFGFTFEYLKIKSRKTKYRLPRQISCYLLKKYTSNTLEEIGDMLNVTHCNVLHSIKVIENEISTNKQLRETIKKIELCL